MYISELNGQPLLIGEYTAKYGTDWLLWLIADQFGYSQVMPINKQDIGKALQNPILKAYSQTLAFYYICET